MLGSAYLFPALVNICVPFAGLVSQGVTISILVDFVALDCKARRGAFRDNLAVRTSRRWALIFLQIHPQSMPERTPGG